MSDLRDTPLPANTNVDTAPIMALQGVKVALGLIDAPAPLLQIASPPAPEQPQLTIIQGGLTGS